MGNKSSVNTGKPTKRAVNYESVRLHVLYYEMYDKMVLGPKARPLFFQHSTPGISSMSITSIGWDIGDSNIVRVVRKEMIGVPVMRGGC